MRGAYKIIGNMPPKYSFSILLSFRNMKGIVKYQSLTMSSSTPVISSFRIMKPSKLFVYPFR